MSNRATEWPAGDEDLRPSGSEWLHWESVIAAFWVEREWRIRAFHEFLTDWKLNDVLGTPRVGPSADRHETPWEEDRKVLGFHRFHKWDDVVDYALQWSTNPAILDTHLWQHRITLARGIDLICGELLANGFEHSGKEGAQVFIMAKLCSSKSAWTAIELNKRSPYLTPVELSSFQLSVEREVPILQLCIADAGQGFGRNERLRAEYRKTNASAAEPWACLEKVDTKFRRLGCPFLS